MCDTMGFHSGGRGYFAKNSDRSPNEPQILEFCPPREPSENGRLKTTYLDIRDADAPTHSVLLSRPVWMWGAEMGVNDAGVCIGNEAVFTKGKYAGTGLTGMDLLRLALERSADAREAAQTIRKLLETYGQGGDCGYDHEFRYDNSFLITDRNETLVLETCARDSVIKASERASISNRLCVGADGDDYTGDKCDFAGTHTEPVYTHFSSSAGRRTATQCCVNSAKDIKDLIHGLRSHSADEDHFAKGTVGSVCMHTGGLVGDHTTASMAVEVGPDGILVFATGTSLPCVSLFKPWLFGSAPSAPVFTPGDKISGQYWMNAERYRRRLIGRVIPAAFYEQRDKIEESWLAEAKGAKPAQIEELTRRTAAQEAEFYAAFPPESFEKAKTSGRFRRYWEKKGMELEKPARPFIY